MLYLIFYLFITYNLMQPHTDFNKLKYTTTNIATATNPVYAAPHHHGREGSAYTG